MSFHFEGAEFSMPMGASLYPPPPYEFRDAEQVSFAFTADPAGAAKLLPRGLELADNPAKCEIRVCWYHWSTFGPFHETYALIRVRDKQDRYFWYLPLIFTDNEAPLAAGRELWGYPKKLAKLDWDWGGSRLGQPTNEILRFSAERPSGLTLFAAAFAPERLADPAERHGLPVVSWRYLPPSEQGRPPAADELIVLSSPKTIQRDAAGELKLWAGRGSLTIGCKSDVDPWYLLAPLEMTGAFWQVSDFALPTGTILRDYLIDPVTNRPL